MDKNQIIHIASEVVVISGLAIYFKLQTNSLSTQVEELKKRIITQEQLIEEFKNSLDEHSIVISKQEQLLKQCLKNQTQAQSYKQKSRSPKENVGIVWDSDNDSSYFPEKSVKQLKKVYQPSEQKLDPPINKVRVRPPIVEERRFENDRVRVRHPIVEERRVENDRVRVRPPVVEEKRVENDRDRVRPPIIENLDENDRDRVRSPIIENLDEELQNELLELEDNSENSESEIIEIDTSLKKKA